MSTFNHASKRGRLALGILIFVFGVLLFKSLRLSLDVSGSVSLTLRYLLLDASFAGLLTLLAVAHAKFRNRVLRVTGLVFLLLAALFYAVHSFVLIELDEYMSLGDLGRYLPEWEMVRGFLGPVSALVIVMLVLAALWHVPLGRGTQRWLVIGSVCVAGAGAAASYSAPGDLGRYALIPVSRIAEALADSQPVSVYAPAEAEHFSRFAPHEAELPAHQPDIILLIVESLSSINSKRTSGVHDLLPEFDRVSEKGVLFTHFMANHAASEGGIISLLSGFPPLHFPTATPLMFDEFASQPAVISDYQDAGYFTEFLTNADLSFIGLSRYLEGLQLDLVRGRDEVPEFAAAPRFVQDAPSDRYLYEEALRRLQARSGDDAPWLLVLATASTHLPYTHPEGGEDSAAAVWQWSMAQLEDFVEALERHGYFEQGMLLITGDHRQMRPLTEAETQRYGDSARSRVPLLVIGSGLPAGKIDDRLFQQADLLRYLGRVGQADQTLSSHSVWVERYNRIYGRVESINRFKVFEQQADVIAGYPVRVLGTRLQWLEGRPASFRAVEAAIHAQRSAHQFVRNGDAPACTAGLANGVPVSSGQQGLSRWRIPDSDIRSLRVPARAPDLVPELGLEEQGEADPQLEWYLAYLDVEESGTYWFRSLAGNRLCMSLDGQLVLDQLGSTSMQAPVELESGRYLLDLRFAPGMAQTGKGLQWIEPGLSKWRWRPVPGSRLKPALPAEVELR